MRVHITLDEAEVRRLDARVGARRRSSFIQAAVRRALDEEYRWERIEAAIGEIQDGDHDWDGDVAGWVGEQRRSDDRRIG